MLYLDLRGIMFLKIPVWLGHELFGRCRPDGLNAKHPQQYGRYNKQARLYFGRCNGNYHPPRTVIRSSTSEQIGCCRKRFTGIVACLQPVCPKQLVHFTFHTRSTTMRGDRYPIFQRHKSLGYHQRGILLSASYGEHERLCRRSASGLKMIAVTAR